MSPILGSPISYYLKKLFWKFIWILMSTQKTMETHVDKSCHSESIFSTSRVSQLKNGQLGNCPWFLEFNIWTATWRGGGQDEKKNRWTFLFAFEVGEQNPQNRGVPKHDMKSVFREHIVSLQGAAYWSHTNRTFPKEATVLKNISIFQPPSNG